jgi:hypothetical protein
MESWVVLEDQPVEEGREFLGVQQVELDLVMLGVQ